MRRLRAQQDSLRQRPPAYWFLAVYFEAQGWWRRPGAAPAPSAEAEPAPPLLPEYEP